MDSKQHVHESFVSAAIFFALTAGFGYGAILVGVDSFRIPLGVWWIALAQAHGHVQLFGWAGLFVLGVGLYFLPRLRGTTLALPVLARYSLFAGSSASRYAPYHNLSARLQGHLCLAGSSSRLWRPLALSS